MPARKNPKRKTMEKMKTDDDIVILNWILESTIATQALIFVSIFFNFESIFLNFFAVSTKTAKISSLKVMEQKLV